MPTASHTCRYGEIDGKTWVCIDQVTYSDETETSYPKLLKKVESKRITPEDLFRYLTPDSNTIQYYPLKYTIMD